MNDANDVLAIMYKAEKRSAILDDERGERERVSGGPCGHLRAGGG